MKESNNIKIVISLATILLCLTTNIVLAKGKIDVTSGKQQMEKGQETEITVNIDNTSVASMTLQIYFDMAKLEYVPKTENANLAQNRVIYIWANSSGENKERQSKEIEKFTFRAVQEGTANVIVTGEFYDESGNKIDIDDGSIEVKIGKQENRENNTIDDEPNENVSSDNTNLKIMRLSEVGISPDFQKDIKDYYFIADNTIHQLEVTAIPENKNAKVTITGNTNLKIGKNMIKIEVISEDKTKKSIYTIHVTKTDNMELANSNLENLAVREAMIFPSFDSNITEYQMEIGSDITKLDILAIPENTNASVSIIGNEELKTGDNMIIVNVVAPDKITSKKYKIKAHKRNEQEEIEARKEEKSQTEQLSSILANEQIQDENQNRSESNNKNEPNKKINIWSIMIGAIIIGGSCFITFIYFKTIKKKE